MLYAFYLAISLILSPSNAASLIILLKTFSTVLSLTLKKHKITNLLTSWRQSVIRYDRFDSLARTATVSVGLLAAWLHDSYGLFLLCRNLHGQGVLRWLEGLRLSWQRGSRLGMSFWAGTRKGHQYHRSEIGLVKRGFSSILPLEL